MKRIFAILLTAGLLVACKEYTIGQYPIDSIPPAKVTNPQVENLPGRVIVSYTLPDETDLLYVRADYDKSDGTKGSVKASVFNNQLEIVGFGRSKKQTIQLVTVDRSQNESAPVPVEIEPLDGSVYSISETMNIEETWGGIKMTWDNPMEDGVFLTVTSTDPQGNQLVDTYFSESKEGLIAVRGLENTPYEFKIEVRDLYDNYSEDRIETLTPWMEIMIPLKEIKVLPIKSGWSLASYSKSLSALVDGTTGGDNCVCITKSAGYAYFTFDLGAKYQISRIKIWQRGNYYYTLRNPKVFECWMTDDETAGKNAESYDGWHKVFEGEVIKPSGDGSTVTKEDEEVAKAGHEFEFPEGVTGRYFRYRQLLNWMTPSDEFGTMLNEIHFWGRKIEEEN